MAKVTFNPNFLPSNGCFMIIHSASAQGDKIYFIDSHSQVDYTVAPLNTVISLMNKDGVTHTIASARGKLTGKAFLEFMGQHPVRITPSVGTKGIPMTLDHPITTRQ